MKTLKDNHAAISTVLAFALIPLSGFATDIYLPSFPAMATLFGTSQADIQLSLIVFVVSNGISQLFVGSLLDTFGRYRLSILSLIIFALSSFVIAITHSLPVLLSMRVIQGIAIALIVVSKRAFFIDLYSGSRLKHYTSLFSIMWATAPIIAPFLGGFLQHYLGSQSNFYFLGFATVAILILELIYSGETLKSPQAFKANRLLNVYASKLKTFDFSISLLILGSAFSMVIVFNMASPFIIQHIFHASAVTIGYCSLLSGVAILAGGLISKSQINRPLVTKMRVVAPLLIAFSILMIITMTYFPSLTAFMVIVILIHMASGFTFNTFYTYALGRFSANAGIVSGITGGGTYIVTSILSFSVVTLLHVQNLLMLGAAYLTLAVLISIAFIIFTFAQKRIITTEAQPAAAV
jgi:DHA1 family bicyclomycin/chloramphenicol resistance-like MFS transporter